MNERRLLDFEENTIKCHGDFISTATTSDSPNISLTKLGKEISPQMIAGIENSISASV